MSLESYGVLYIVLCSTFGLSLAAYYFAKIAKIKIRKKDSHPVTEYPRLTVEKDQKGEAKLQSEEGLLKGDHNILVDAATTIAQCATIYMTQEFMFLVCYIFTIGCFVYVRYIPSL